jgi:ubiquinone/menaquinone biosynthesis C-methylase UbiE
MLDAQRETRRTYDVIAADFARRAAAGFPELAGHVSWLAANLPPGARVADVGCGPARDTRLLREAGLRAVGLDLSLGQLRAGGVPGLVQADMLRLPVRTAGLDALWCQAALLHIPHTLVPQVLAEFARVVRPSGLLHLAVAEGDGEAWEVATAYGSQFRRFFAYHGEEGLRHLLAESGFTVHFVHRSHAVRDWLTLRATRVS